jgi:hypothetical protein
VWDDTLLNRCAFDERKVLEQDNAKLEEGETLYLYPTYTALLELARHSLEGVRLTSTTF